MPKTAHKLPPSPSEEASLFREQSRTSRSSWCDGSWQQRYIIAANAKAAEFGIPEAQNEMGIRSYVGAGVERNRAAALDWFGKAAMQGNADACYNLGICHAYGQPSEINYSVAVDYFKWAATLGCLDAAAFLVEFHSPRKWSEKDASEVAKWFRMLCQRDIKEREFRRPVSPEYEEQPERFGRPCDWLDIASDLGVKEAQYFKARFNYDRVRNARTVKMFASDADYYDRRACRAFALFRSSSESGFLPSITSLGDCYMEAIGVEKDISEAIRLYRLAAEKGYAPAQNALADIYLDGDAGETDLQKAIELYEKAAAQGNANAQYSLGMCYFTGDGVEKDMGKAWMLLTRAAHGRVVCAYEPHAVVEELVTPQERAKWDEGRRMNPFSSIHSHEELRKWMYNNNYPGEFSHYYSSDYDWRKTVADLGNIKALCDIAVDLVENPTCDDDWARAFKWFIKAADLGEPSAFFNVGKCLMHGIGVGADKARGLMWLEKACASGYKSVQTFLADCYCDGIGCEANPEKAIAIYRRNMMMREDRPKEAFLGVKWSKWRSGDLSYCFSPERRWINFFAEAGDAESQYWMGREVSGWPTVSSDAISWFRKAAEQGHAEAENRLGECYRDGRGVESNLSEAVRWFEKAVEQNNPDALFNLGFLYYSGKGVRRDWAKAKELLERAIEADKRGWPNGAGDNARKCLQEMNANA